MSPKNTKETPLQTNHQFEGGSSRSFSQGVEFLFQKYGVIVIPPRYLEN